MHITIWSDFVCPFCYIGETHLQSVGVQGVPFYVINEQYAFSGAQPVETFLQVLKDVWVKTN